MSLSPPDASLSGRPLKTLAVNRRNEILYNLGVQLLFSGRALAAFDCLVEALQTYHTNPRMWLRLAECCVVAHELVLYCNTRQIWTTQPDAKSRRGSNFRSINMSFPLDNHDVKSAFPRTSLGQRPSLDGQQRYVSHQCRLRHFPRPSPPRSMMTYHVAIWRQVVYFKSAFCLRSSLVSATCMCCTMLEYCWLWYFIGEGLVYGTFYLIWGTSLGSRMTFHSSASRRVTLYRASSAQGRIAKLLSRHRRRNSQSKSKSAQYSELVYTTPVNSAFRAIWLVPLSRDIKYYSPPGGFRRTKWRANPILS